MIKVCQICKRDESKTEIVTGVIVRPVVSNLIKN